MHLTVNVNSTEINCMVKLFIKCIHSVVRDLHHSNNCTVISKLLKANQSKLYQLDLHFPSSNTLALCNKYMIKGCSDVFADHFESLFFFSFLATLRVLGTEREKKHHGSIDFTQVLLSEPNHAISTLYIPPLYFSKNTAGVDKISILSQQWTEFY